MSRRAAQEALQDQLFGAYYRAIDLILVNLIWFVFSALLVTAIPALGGLFYATNRMAHGSSGDWRTFWEGFRKHFWLSWRWGAINAAVFAFLGVNLWFYGQVDLASLSWVRWFMVLAFLLWIILQLFTFPLLLEQADQRFIVATRNSLVLLIRYPFIALGTLIQWLLIVVPSVLLFPPAWIFISASLCAFVANRAVLNAIQRLE